MNEKLDENTIAELLEGLNSADVNVRKNAIQSIIKLEIKDERIINALIRIASSDRKQSARIFAKNALGWLEVEYSLPEVDVPVEEEVEESVSPVVGVSPEPVTDVSSFLGRYRQQIAGFIGWFALASLLAPISFGLITTPATLICLLLFARSKTSKGIAGGILTAVALNFVISLARGLSLNGFCFMPFYYY